MPLGKLLGAKASMRLRSASCCSSRLKILLRQPSSCSFIQPLSQGSCWSASHTFSTHPPSPLNLDALGAQYTLASALTATPVFHDLEVIANQGPFFFPLLARHSHHTECLGVAAQVAIQFIAKLTAVAPIGLLLLASLPHGFGYHHQVLYPKLE